MIASTPATTVTHYETDETGWLDQTAELVRERRLAEVDLDTLAEYLTDMARRDRREVSSRLALLLAHLLKWQLQPDKRTGSWRATIEVQRQELAELLEGGTLRNHATEVLAKAYENGVRQAVAETGLDATAFPTECPYTVVQLLTVEPE